MEEMKGSLGKGAGLGERRCPTMGHWPMVTHCTHDDPMTKGLYTGTRSPYRDPLP